jgi:hypothetical protein
MFDVDISGETQDLGLNIFIRTSRNSYPEFDVPATRMV